MSLNNFVKSIQDIMRNDAGVNGDAQRIEQMTWILFLKIYDYQEENWEFDDDDYKSIIPEEHSITNPCPSFLLNHKGYETLARIFFDLTIKTVLSSAP